MILLDHNFNYVDLEIIGVGTGGGGTAGPWPTHLSEWPTHLSATLQSDRILSSTCPPATSQNVPTPMLEMSSTTLNETKPGRFTQYSHYLHCRRKCKRDPALSNLDFDCHELTIGSRMTLPP